MKKDLLISIRLTLATMLLFGVVYPLLITGIAFVAAPSNGTGQTVSANGRVVGFEVIGQSFTSDRYFTSRPSAVGYNAAATGGSNKGPTNSDYLAQVEERITEVLAHNPTIRRHEIPVDLVTASGGGLDPDISIEAAKIQVNRIAASRNMSQQTVVNIINKNTEGPLFGVFGPGRVNVLKANIDLDSNR